MHKKKVYTLCKGDLLVDILSQMRDLAIAAAVLHQALRQMHKYAINENTHASEVLPR